MARNFVESHIQDGALHTFKVEAGQVVKIGQLVEVSATGKVQVAGADSTKVIGVVYSGTVGVDGKNVGYDGDQNMVATVVVNKPFVYLEASGTFSAGDPLKAGANGTVVKLDTVAGDTAFELVAIALEDGVIGERARSILV